MYCVVAMVAVFTAMVSASEPPVAYKAEEYKKTDYKAPEPAYDGYSKQLYRGMYKEQCDQDGFYYSTEYSFVMCSNGNKYEQRCAPGSRNSGYKSYTDGDSYYLHDFCDVNMVDFGFNGYAKGHDKPAPKGYGNEALPKTDGYEVKPEVAAPYNNKKLPEVVAAYPALKPVVVATDYDKSGYGQKSYDVNPFRGYYEGKCGTDGFYFNNDASFVVCSNGNAYVQRCAPGSRNSGYKQYQNGKSYLYRDFCDVNLVDYGYSVPFAHYPGLPFYPHRGYF